VNYSDASAVNTAFTSGLGPDGAFKIVTGSPTDLVIDVSGAYVPAGP
jgi:hypothetical protein